MKSMDTLMMTCHILGSVLSNQPNFFICNTIKGKGISFMENVPSWHGSVKIKSEELIRALSELNTPPDDISLYLSQKFLHEKTYEFSLFDRLKRFSVREALVSTLLN